MAAVAPGFKAPIVWKLSPASRTASVKVRSEWFSIVPTNLPLTSCRRAVKRGAVVIVSVPKPPREKAVIPDRVTSLVATLTRMLLPELLGKPPLFVAIGLMSSRSPAMRAS